MTQSDARDCNAWITLCDAVDLLSPKLGDEDTALRLISEHAATGDLPSIAGRANGRFAGKDIDENDWLIPASAWLGARWHAEFCRLSGGLILQMIADRYSDLDDCELESLRLRDVIISRERLDKLIEKLPVQWIRASDARLMLAQKLRYVGEPKPILERARAGLIRSRARLLVIEPLVRIRMESPREESSLSELSTDFWVHAAKSLKATWATGDFFTNSNLVRMSAFGVEFERAALNEMLGERADDRSEAAVELTDDQKFAFVDGTDRRSEVPPDDVIKAKMLELCAMGIRRDIAAKLIRQLAGFGGVGNVHARRAVNGELPRGRPEKRA